MSTEATPANVGCNEGLGLAGVVRPLTDIERLDFLQWLTTRTDYQNQKRPTESVGSDMHLGSGACSLYVRDLLGNIVSGGASQSEDVREAIDAVAAVLRPNQPMKNGGGSAPTNPRVISEHKNTSWRKGSTGYKVKKA